MKQIIAITLFVIGLTACHGPSNAVASSEKSSGRSAHALTEEEKHRLYSAALAVSESPLDNETFKTVCRKIGIFDTEGKPNGQYLAFVAAHVDWALRPELEQFKQEINTREKAREYVSKHLPE